MFIHTSNLSSICICLQIKKVWQDFAFVNMSSLATKYCLVQILLDFLIVWVKLKLLESGEPVIMRQYKHHNWIITKLYVKLCMLMFWFLCVVPEQRLPTARCSWIYALPPRPCTHRAAYSVAISKFKQSIHWSKG